ncbi:MAG: glycosyltransferase [Chitinophagales bacterium]|nr:glycosyltransferase [Chitinophagaceae bacterium]MCB9064326.1 glycosyltransferase [Chitinophagales bacterium]
MSTGRILILTNRVPYPLKDGGNLAMKAMIDGYHANGNQVYLLSMNTSRHPVDKDVASEVYGHIYAFETVNVNNDIGLFPLLNNLVFSNEPNHVMRFRKPAFIKKLKEVLASFKPDIVQVESVYLSSYLTQIKFSSTAKTVLRLHNVEYQIWERLAQQVKNPLKRYYINNLGNRIRKYEQRVWKEYDLLLPITMDDDKTVRKSVNGKVRTHVVPYTIDTQQEPIHHQEKAVGYHIGAMDWLPNEEGINWFITDVWNEIRKTSPDFEFYFAGRHMPEYLKNINENSLHCVGEVDDANAFISDKKILIVPIRSGGGIRVKVLEAMAQNKVVVSTSIGMQGIEAKDKVHYLQANDAQEFAVAISWVLNNDEKARTIAENALHLIRTQYSTKPVYQGLQKEIDRISAR